MKSVYNNYMEHIKLFFQQLANKSNSEPDLSDITAFVLNCSPKFLAFFLKVFFPKELKNISDKTDIEIEREFPSENQESRVDFKFTIQGFSNPFLVENKIGDRNYHSEYSQNYPNCALGFIANYDVNGIPELEKTYGSHKISWFDFYKKLNDFINNDVFAETEKLLLSGYSEYIRSVCGIMEKRDFKPELSRDLDYLYKIFKSLIEKKEKNWIDSRSKACDTYCIGTYFYINNNYYWAGIYTADWDNNIYIEAYQKNIDEFQEESYNYCKIQGEEDGYIWFKLKDEYLKELNSDPDKIDVDKKFEILENFFNEVISICEK